MAATNDADLWVRRFRPADADAPRLVCLPHAGGSASYFIPFAAALSPAVEVLAVQYPGRQDRRTEPGIEDLHELAAKIFTQLDRPSDRRTALFGHSMGATLAYEVTRLLEAAGGTVDHLFVSARRGPECRRDDRLHQLGEDELLAHMAALNGTDSRLLADEELRAILLPPLRSDYRAIETYVHHGEAKVACPVTALGGDDDPVTTVSELDTWRAHTLGSFERRILPGGHFYLTDNQSELSRLVIQRLGVDKHIGSGSSSAT